MENARSQTNLDTTARWLSDFRPGRDIGEIRLQARFIIERWCHPTQEGNKEQAAMLSEGNGSGPPSGFF